MLQSRAKPLFGRMATKGVVSVADQLLVSAASFLTSVMIARREGEDELGMYALMMAFVVMVLVVQQSLVLTPYTTLVHQIRKSRRRAYSGTILLQGLGLGSAALFLLLAAAVCSFLFEGIHLYGLFVALCIATPAALLRDWVRRYLLAHLQTIKLVVFDVTVTLGQLAILGWLAWQADLTAQRVLFAIGLCVGCVALGAIYCLKSEFIIRPTSFPQFTRQNWDFGRWILGYELSGAMRIYVLYWLLAAGVDVAATGAMAACTTIVGVVNPVFLGLVGVSEPRMAAGFASGGIGELRRLTGKISLILLGLVGSFCLFIAVIGSTLLSLIFGETFAEYAPTLNLLSLAMAVSVVSYPAACAVRTAGRPELNFAVRIASLIVALCTAAMLIPNWGVFGAACGAFAGGATAALGRWRALAQVLFSPLPQEAKA